MTTSEGMAESKKNHLWCRTVWQTDPELHPLGPHHSVAVYCCEESNGFAVWYVRKLPHIAQLIKNGVKSGAENSLDNAVENGDYLLAYFGPHRRDDAITHAVMASTGSASSALQIAALDELARHVQKM